MSITRRLAFDAPVFSADVGPCPGIDPDGVSIALARAGDRVAHGPELVHGGGVLADSLEAHPVREPLVVQPRRIDGRADVHVELQHVEDDLQRGVDDGPAAGTAGDQHHLAVLGHDGRRLRAEHPFARSDLVGGRADVAVARRHSGEPVEVHHLVVEQEAGPLDHDARAVAAFQRVGVADGHAVAVDHREMRGAVALARELDLRGQFGAGRRLGAIDAVGQLFRVVLAGQVLGDLDEVLVAEVAGAIAVGPAHASRSAGAGFRATSGPWS